MHLQIHSLNCKHWSFECLLKLMSTLECKIFSLGGAVNNSDAGYVAHFHKNDDVKKSLIFGCAMSLFFEIIVTNGFESSE